VTAHPPCLSCADEGLVFVFGSNSKGIHGAGAALHAREKHGAILGRGHGLQGMSYAIDTMSGMDLLKLNVAAFLDFAQERQDLRFFVTKVGCGLAGYTEKEIAPLFADAPPNCTLPEGWRTK